MLLETIARRTLALKNHNITKPKIGDDGSIELHIRAKKRHKLPSSCCGKKEWATDLLPPRTWVHLSIFGIAVKIIYQPRRVRCCGKLIVERIPWSRGKCRLTTQLIMAISIMAKLLPWQQVAGLFSVQRFIEDHGVSERTIRNYLSRYKERGAEGLVFIDPKGLLLPELKILV